MGSHRYNRVRRERISGGSLTFPFVGSHDALGNRVIRFRPYAGWLAGCTVVRLSYSRPRVREDYDAAAAAVWPSGDSAQQNRLLCSLSLLHLAFVNVAKRCGDDESARRSIPNSSVRRNYSPMITAHLHRAAIAATLSKHKLFIVVAVGSDSRAEFEITC